MNYPIKKTLLATALSCALPFTATANIVITEYVEGSSNNKAVEISNLGSAAVNMDGYKLAMYTNGSPDEHSDRKYLFSGTLAAGASFVLYNASAEDQFKPTSNSAESNVTWYNGDDALVLSKDGVVVDSLGRVGEDPGSAWTDANDENFSTANKTIRRMASVTSGDTTIDDEFPGSTNQWVTFDINTADGLGCPGEGACTGTSEPVNTVLITEYVEGSSSNKAIEITNIGSEEVDLGAGKYKLALFGNGATDEREDRTLHLTAILAPGASWVVYNDRAEEQFQFPEMGETSSVTFFNGDDAIVLSRDGTVVDSFGRVGEDPGSAWTDANNADWSTANKTLRRMANITTGDTAISDEFPGSDNQWLVFDINTWDGLGCGGEEICPANVVLPPNTIIISEYVEGFGNNRAVEITNVGTEDINLGQYGYKMSVYADGATEPTEGRIDELEGTLAAGQSLVLYNGGATAEFKPVNGVASVASFFDGNDTVVLSRGNNEIVDVFGRIGENPGMAWTDSNNAEWTTQNVTLRRKADIVDGDANGDDAFPGDANQWVAFANNTADGLGCSGEGSCGNGGGDGGDGGGEPAGPGEGIIITEYVEGTGNNKVIEITNISAEAIDMGAEKYKVALYANGETEESADRKIDLTGVLNAGESFMIYNESAAPEFQFPENGAASAATFFNGDDVVVVVKDGVIVDSLGRIGERPQDQAGWTDPNNPNFGTNDITLRRKANVLVGDADATDPFPGDNNQWVVFPVNTSDGLGCAGTVACPTDTSGTVENYILITEYVEGSFSNKAIELTNIGEEDVDLFEQNYRLAAFNNGRTTESNALNLFGLLPPGASIVIYNRDADEEFKKPAPQGIGSNVTFFNGDDALVLTKGGVVVDSLGRVGERPDTQWTDEYNPYWGTYDMTLRRLPSVTLGDFITSDAFPGDQNQWEVFSKDTSDGLGCGGLEACTGDEPQALEGIGGGVTIGACVNCPEISKVASMAAFDDAEYYAAATAVHKSERAAQLAQIMKEKHVQLLYSQVWSVVTFADEDPDNADNIIEIYTGNSVPKMMNGSGENANNPDAWNREHVWSKSKGFPNESQMGYTDAHHLRPADASMNSRRSNLDFDNGGDAIEEAPENFMDSDSFEPRDDVKGDVARMMFYMETRYDGAPGEDTPNLQLIDEVGTTTDDSKFGRLCALYQWHYDDPVDEREIARNNVIFEYQGNRNPFIDHPEWVEDIYKDRCIEPLMPVIDIQGPISVSEGATVTLNGAGTVDNDGDTFTFLWQQVTHEHISFDPNGQSVSFKAPSVDKDTVITFRLTVDDGDIPVSKEFSVVIEDTSDDNAGSIGGGAISYLTLLLLPLVGLRRRLIKH